VGLLATVVFIIVVMAIGVWLVNTVMLGIGLGLILAIVGLVAITFTMMGFSSFLASVLYLLTKALIVIFILSLIAGIFTWIRNVFITGC
jgi:hypothetical protein